MNYQFDTETNVVDVYINYLRKKLTFAGDTPQADDMTLFVVKRQK